jgi:hypothetical protein
LFSDALANPDEKLKAIAWTNAYGREIFVEEWDKRPRRGRLVRVQPTRRPDEERPQTVEIIRAVGQY